MKPILILILAAVSLVLASCAVPASPQVQAHAAESTSPQGMAAAQTASNNFWH
jgi:hypothetical protein